MRLLFLLLMVLVTPYGYGQKILSKTYPVPDNALVQLDARNNYNVEVRTTNRDDMLIEAVMEGEYQGEMLVQITESGNTLHLATRNQPAFDFPNDKLSAHKVISVGLRISLPEHLSFQLYGRSATVSVQGAYKDVRISLSSGNCSLEVEAEQASVKTLSGHIRIEAKPELVAADSQYGLVDGNAAGGESAIYTLNTITGNITIHNKE